MIVVKVGGSLYTEPKLGSSLRSWLAGFSEPVVLVPGGGGFADVVRNLDLVHSFEESVSHWLAIRSLTLSRHFLHELVGDSFSVLDCFEYFSLQDKTPHSWDVTSDSLALAYAQAQQASRLVLLKSISKPETINWQDASALGIVDSFFPKLLNQQWLPVEIVNFKALHQEQIC